MISCRIEKIQRFEPAEALSEPWISGKGVSKHRDKQGIVMEYWLGQHGS